MGEDQINYIIDSLKGEYESKRTSSLTNTGGPTNNQLGFGSSALLNGVEKQASSPVSATSTVKVDINSTHERNSRGEYIAKYEDYNRFGNTAEEYANNQRTSEKWLNGLAKFGGKALTATVGGIVGGAYGLLEYMRTGAESTLYDNEVTNYFSDLDKMMNNKLPNYYTQKEIDGSFTDNLFTANFIANDVLGGAAFTVGAIGSEFLIGKGAGLIPKLSRLPQYLNRVSKAKSKAMEPVLNASRSGVLYSDAGISNIGASINLGKTQELAKTMRFIYTSSGYEAGVEALQFKTEQMDSFASDFFKETGRQPTEEETKQFITNLNRAANSLYTFNVAVTGSSKMAQIGNLVGIKTPTLIDKAWVSNKVFGAGVNRTGEAVKANKFQKGMRLAYANIKNEISEGLEEGLQSVGSKTAEKWLTSTYDPKHIGGMIDIFDNFMQGVADMALTEEGRKEFLTGALVGGLTGRATSMITGQSAMKDFKNLDKRAQEFETYTKEQLQSSIAFAGRVAESQAKLDEAESSGNITEAELARKEQTLAYIEHVNKLGFADQGKDMAIESINSIDTASLAKTLGISESEAESYKQEMVLEYNRLSDRYNRNKEFASYYVGDDIKNATEVHSAIATTLTLGESAYDFNKSILDTLKSKLTGLVTGIDSIDIHATLSMATETTKKDFENTVNELHKQRENLGRLEQEQKEAIKYQGERTEASQRLNEIAATIQDTHQKMVDLQNKLTDILQIASMENPYNEGESRNRVVTEQDLVNLDNVLNSLESLPRRLKSTNPSLASAIDNMIREYNRSNKIFKEYSKMSSMIMEGKIDFSKMSEKAFKGKTQGELVLDFLETIGVDEEGNRVSLTERVNADLASNISKYRLHRAEPKPKVRVEGEEGAIIANNPYLQLKSGGEKISSQRPTEEEITRYNELKSKEDLDSQEEVELQELNDKLSQWELYDDFLNEGVSILDILEMEQQMTEAPQEVDIELDTQILGEMVEDSNNAVQNTSRSYEVTQTYEGVQIRTTKDGTFLHSVDKATFLSNLGDVVVEENGDATSIIHEDGTKTVLRDVRPGVLKVEGWDNLENNSNVSRMKYNYSKGTYGFVYVNGDMMKGSLEGNPIYNYEAIYELGDDSQVHFYVDVNDPYNKTLTEEELLDNLKIYVVDSKGNVIGDLKSNNSLKGVHDNFLAVREEAAQVYKNGGGALSMVLPVKHVHLGTPVFRLENGEPLLQEADSRDIVAYGYYSGGKFQLNKDIGYIRTTFVSKLQRKAPVIVLKRGNKFIAFPVVVKRGPSNKGQEIIDKFDTDNIGKAVLFANNLALENGLPATLYFKGSDNQNIFNEHGDLTPEVMNLVDSLNKVPTEVDLLSVEEGSIGSRILTPINPGSKPFTSPKVVLSFEDMTRNNTPLPKPVSIKTEAKNKKVKNVSTPKKKEAPVKPTTPKQVAPTQSNINSEIDALEAQITPGQNIAGDALLAEGSQVEVSSQTSLTKAPAATPINKSSGKVPTLKTPAKTVIERSGRNYTVNNTNIAVDSNIATDKVIDSEILGLRTREITFKEGATQQDFRDVLEDGDLVFGNSNTYVAQGDKLKVVDKPVRQEIGLPQDPKRWTIVKTIGKLSDIDTNTIQNKKC